ncbi:hypothetical protein EU537_02510 [Candidatus Thorarchaeota archaeon]|nr:MAG: hypothetical protein EU537_02510 [Candidatus Thorarchaeota archaeon]
MNSEKKKSDEYWMGVRDALRMVDSFVKWSSRYKADAKTLEEFIHDGLIAAAKRCESCLSEQLGLRFDREKDDKEYADEEDEELEDEHPGTDFESSHFPEDAEYEQESDEEYLTEEEHDELSVDESSSGMVDSIAGTTASMSEESLTDGEARDFEEDFEVAEPMPYELEETEPAEPSSEEPIETADTIAEVAPIDSDAIGHEETDSEIEEDVDTSDLEDSDEPSFTWKDYESEMDETSEGEYTEKESMSAPKSWSPMDEPPVPEELEDDEDLEDEDVGEASDGTEENEKQTPPPPPPPPETDDSEEERKRRARRLFFGT